MENCLIFPHSTLAARGAVTRCHNLRPDPDTGMLRLVDNDSQVETSPSSLPIPSGGFHEPEIAHEISCSRVDGATISVTTPAITLKGTYTSASRSLATIDRDAIDTAVRKAYIELADLAMAHGRFIQPLVVRFTLSGRDGKTLYVSGPVIVGPKDGSQVTRLTLRLTGEGFRTVEPITLTATEFHPVATIAGDREGDMGKDSLMIGLHVSPQLHPLSTSLPGDITRESATSGVLTFIYTLPGVIPEKGPVRARDAAIAILDNLDGILQPYRDTPVHASAAAELSALQSVLAAKPSPPSAAGDALAVQLSCPHSFSAGSAARNGDLIAWGNIRPIPFDGYSAAELSTTPIAGTVPVPTASLVDMTDGSAVVRAIVMTGRDLSAISPLVTYPSPDAVSTTLLVGRKVVTLPLAPTPGRRLAYFLSPTLGEIHFTDEREGFVLPAASPSTATFPSAIVISSASSPREPLAVTLGDASEVMTILPAVRHSNSFTVPSARFYVLGTGGVSSMTLNERRSAINLNILDRRPLRSPSAVAAIPGGIAAVLGSQLVLVRGSRPATLLDSCDATDLGWCGATGELWCIDPSGITVTDLTASSIYTRDRLLGDSELRGMTAGYTVTIPNRRRPGESIYFTFTPPLGCRGGRVTISYAHELSNDSPRALLASFSLPRDSSTSHPLTARIVIPHCHYITLDYTND